MCGSQRLGRDGMGREQRTEQKTTGQGKCIRACIHQCGWGEKKLKENVVDTKESGGRQYVEFR